MRRYKIVSLICLAGLAFTPALFAANRYVAPGGTNNSPYTNWADAATNIQWAVDAATDGDTIYISNGVYVLTNQIGISGKGLTFQSFRNGSLARTNTIIDGAGANGCFYIDATGYNVVIDGVTITNAWRPNNGSSGGGICAYHANLTTIRNCTIVNCIASRGGGIWAYNPILASNCDINYNIANDNSDDALGGGIMIAAGSGSLVANCNIIGNRATNVGNKTVGGGVLIQTSNGRVENCVIMSNYSRSWGGGVGTKSGGYLKNNLICNNSAGSSGGGVRNWVVVATPEPLPTIINCTIVSNSCGGTSSGGGVYGGYYTNCIIYFNSAPDAYSNWYGNTTTVTTAFYSCCSVPTNSELWPGSANNITNDPQFVDFVGGNYRLNANSPCLNAGTNQNWMTNSVDLDGRMRIRYGIVDIGAYETIYNGSSYKFW